MKFIADNMRKEDVEEVMASGGYTPTEAIETSVSASNFTVVVTIDDTPIAILGLNVYDIMGGKGIPWLLSAEQALKHKRVFLELSKPIIDEMLDKCPYLINHVYTKNTVSKRWLKWLGFTIEKAKPLANGEMFHRFYMRK